MWYVYIIECFDGTLYTGITNNLDKRLASHNSGKGSKYTANRLPVKYVWHETCETRSQALKRELQIKHMSRQEKLTLLKSSE